MAILNAEDVARYFLAKQEVVGTGDGITNLKIQKLCYYAQGFALVRLRRPLFFEDIEHWSHGPVIPSLWRTYRQFGTDSIILEGPVHATKYTYEVRPVLDEVFTRYGKFSATTLRNMTHGDSPWLNTPDGAPITHQAMREFFGPLIENTTPLDEPGKEVNQWSTLAAEMANDQRFRELTEQGIADISAGRYSRLADVKRALGDV